MAWFVVAAVNPAAGTSGVAHASVQQFANAAAYNNTVGASPQQVDPHQPPNGYATQAQAQAEANRWNSQPASQRQAGTLPNPNADTVLPPNLKVPNPLKLLGNVDDFIKYPEKALAWISNRENIARIAKVIVGGVMILVGINMLVTKESSVVNAAETVAKVVK